jgi:hypothetical protein
MTTPPEGTEKVTNEQLAERLTEEAQAASQHRRALLTASVALASTTTLAAARKVLAETDDLPPRVIGAALAILDTLPAGGP